MIERMEDGIKRKTLAAAGLAIAALAIAMPVLNPDIYWHLSAGRWMALHRALPSADFLSWTERGAPWTDFEWLSQLAFYAAWSAAGKAGLFALKLAVLGAAFLPFLGLLRLYGLASAGWWALPLWGLALLPNSDVRPENFSVLFFALLLWRLEKSRVSGRAWPSGAAGFAGLAAFFAVWANLHAGFAYGILLLLTYAAGAAADRRSGGTLSTWPPLFAAFAAAAGALVNPWGWRIYSVLIEHSADAASLSRWLAEWMAPRLSNPLHWPFFAMAAACAALMAWRWERLRRPPAAHLAALCWLGFGAFSHSRHLVFFCMAALAFSLDSAAAVYGAERTARAGRALLAAALLYLAAAVWPRYLAFGVNIGEEAAGAADYLRANAAALGGRRLYNPWNWGGYLGWALPPEFAVLRPGDFEAVKLALCAGQLKKEDLSAELARYAALPGRPSSEARALSEPALRLRNRAHLAGEAHLPHHREDRADRLARQRRGDRHAQREIRRGLGKRHAPGDVYVDVLVEQPESDALFEHREQ
ncbi:MAG TPA: hypothetical protein PKI19_09125 [Elusimicrobiales bacterium]|nr:hypothetical protein [Elusimicrobiales bacterium]